MRTALLSALKRDDTGQLRAFLPLAGRCVLGWQIDFARSLGCERIMCLCQQADEELLALQREVEHSGAEFHAVRSNLQLAALMRSGDQVLMLLDGLVPDPGEAALFDTGLERLRSLVIALPADAEVATANPYDFERIDAERAWAGTAVLGASTVAKLADFPPDSEAVSLLLRMALQDSVPCELRSERGRITSDPVLATSRESLISHQKSLMKSHSEAAIWSAPFVSLARRLAARLVMQQSSISPAGLLGASAASFTIAAALMVFDQYGIGLILAAIGAFSAQGALSSVTLRARLHSRGKIAAWKPFVSPVIDIATVVALLMALERVGAPLELMALPLFAIGLARIAAHKDDSRLGMLWSDRTLHLLGFAAAAFAGMLAPFTTVFGIGALAYKLLHTLRN